MNKYLEQFYYFRVATDFTGELSGSAPKTPLADSEALARQIRGPWETNPSKRGRYTHTAICKTDRERGGKFCYAILVDLIPIE